MKRPGPTLLIALLLLASATAATRGSIDAGVFPLGSRLGLRLIQPAPTAPPFWVAMPMPHPVPLLQTSFGPVSNSLWYHGRWGNHETSLAAAVFARRCGGGGGVVILDVGAHVGFYALLARAHGCSAIAVEPDAHCLAAASLAVAANGWGTAGESENVPSVRLVRGILAGGVFPAEAFQGDNPATFLAPPPHVHLPDLLDDVAQVAYVKLDTEGGEVAALEALAPLFAAQRVDYVYVEITTAGGMSGLSDEAQQIIDANRPSALARTLHGTLVANGYSLWLRGGGGSEDEEECAVGGIGCGASLLRLPGEEDALRERLSRLGTCNAPAKDVGSGPASARWCQGDVYAVREGLPSLASLRWREDEDEDEAHSSLGAVAMAAGLVSLGPLDPSGPLDAHAKRMFAIEDGGTTCVLGFAFDGTLLQARVRTNASAFVAFSEEGGVCSRVGLEPGDCGLLVDFFVTQCQMKGRN